MTLRYAGASWTRVTADGRLAFEGTPGPRQRRTFTARRCLNLVLGYPAGVRVTVNGRNLGVADRSGNIWRQTFTPRSRSLRGTPPWLALAMTDQPRLALTFEDVLLVPRRSSIRSRRHVSTRSRFTRGVELAIPVVSANMDTVTTAPMAIAMAELGGLGVLHRFLPVDAQAGEAGGSSATWAR